MLSRAVLGGLLAVAPVAAGAAGPYTTVAMSDAELSSVRGTGLPFVGLDREDDARRMSEIRIVSLGPRAADLSRELTDNWNFAVALPLIGAAASRP